MLKVLIPDRNNRNILPGRPDPTSAAAFTSLQASKVSRPHDSAKSKSRRVSRERPSPYQSATVDASGAAVCEHLKAPGGR